MAEAAVVDNSSKIIVRKSLRGLYEHIKSRGSIQISDYYEYKDKDEKAQLVLKKSLPKDFPENITTYGSFTGMISRLKKTRAIVFGEYKGEYVVNPEVTVIFKNRSKYTKKPETNEEKIKEPDKSHKVATVDIPFDLSSLTLKDEPILTGGKIVETWDKKTKKLTISIALELCLQLGDPSLKEGEGNVQ